MHLNLASIGTLCSYAYRAKYFKKKSENLKMGLARVDTCSGITLESIMMKIRRTVETDSPIDRFV